MNTCTYSKNLKKIKTYTDCKLVRFPIQGDKVPDKLWLGSPLIRKEPSYLEMSLKMKSQAIFHNQILQGFFFFLLGPIKLSKEYKQSWKWNETTYKADT